MCTVPQPAAMICPLTGRGAGRGGDGAAKFRPLARPRGVPAVRPVAPIPKPQAPKPPSQIEQRATRDSDDSDDEEEEVEAPEPRDEEQEQGGAEEEKETEDDGSASRTDSQRPTVVSRLMIKRVIVQRMHLFRLYQRQPWRFVISEGLWLLLMCTACSAHDCR